MPFSHFLSGAANSELTSILFSLVIELPEDDASAKILAECFWDRENLHPDILEKLDWLMKDWRKINLKNKSRNVTLAHYYEKSCEKFEKILEKKEKLFGSFYPFVYNDGDYSKSSTEVNETLHIGSRPFESEEAYLKFIDEFYAISFNKLIDKEVEGQSETHKLPLLPCYAKEIAKVELNSAVSQAVSSFQRKQISSEAIHSRSAEGSSSKNNKLLSSHTSPKHSAKNTHSPVITRKKNTETKSSKKLSKSNSTKGTDRNSFSPQTRNNRLFKSRSFSELNDWDKVEYDSDRPVELFETSPKIKRKRASSQSNLLDDDLEDLPPITPRGDAAYYNSQSQRYGGTTPRNRTSTPRTRNSGKGLKSGNRNRSASVTHLNSPNTEENFEESYISSSSMHAQIVPDPLKSPVMEAWMLENMIFHKKYEKVGHLLDWLIRWSGRSGINVFDKSAVSSSNKYHRQQSIMRIRVSSKMILYCLWQLEQNYENHKESAAAVHRRALAATSATEDAAPSVANHKTQMKPEKLDKVLTQKQTGVNGRSRSHGNGSIVDEVDWDKVSLLGG